MNIVLTYSACNCLAGILVIFSIQCLVYINILHLCHLFMLFYGSEWNVFNLSFHVIVGVPLAILVPHFVYIKSMVLSGAKNNYLHSLFTVMYHCFTTPCFTHICAIISNYLLKHIKPFQSTQTSTDQQVTISQNHYNILPIFINERCYFRSKQIVPGNHLLRVFQMLFG